MDSSPATVYESVNDGTLYLPNAIASSSVSSLSSSSQDEHSSRMRSHRGNRPSLPQSKHCPLCPAKFTRTTHLNRHLRTHTNERSHRCDTCLSEFTRSDLLTRHKRSCGDLLNQNKSRRKSCQACAESKVKCDLRQPCTKCTSRGKECIFINDPAQSREKKAAAAARRKAAQSAVTDSSSNSSVSPQPTPAPSHPMLYLSANSYDIEQDTEISLVTGISSVTSSFDISPISPSPISPTDFLYTPSSYSSSYSEFSGSTPTSSSMSPRSDIFDIAADYYATSPEMYLLDESLSKITPQDMVPLYSESSFSMQPCDFVHTAQGLLDFGYESQPHGMMDNVLTACSPLDVDPYIISLSSDAISMDIGLLNDNESPPLVARETSPIDMSPKGTSTGPTEAENYLYLFHTAFQSHVPIVHPSTWTFEGKAPILGRVTQACGAQFIKTQAAKDFVSQTLHSARESLIQVAKSTTESEGLIDMILTGLLVQTINLFRQTVDQRPAASHFHGMLVTLIRRSGLMNSCSSWTPPNLSSAEPSQIDAAWRDWIAHESMKRLLTVAYVHDCFLNIFFSISPSFFASELNWCLPSEDALWNATTSQEWYSLLQQPSPYGSSAARLTGFNLQAALNVLGDERVPTSGLTLPAFAHFVLINSTLSSIYAASGAQAARASDAPDHRDVLSGKSRHSALQFALNNWLLGWVKTENETAAEKAVEEPPLTRNAMPYYWLAQATLATLQEDASDKMGLFVTPETRFRVLGQWLLHIRNFLRNGQSDSARQWIELMHIIADDGHEARMGAEGMQALLPDL